MSDQPDPDAGSTKLILSLELPRSRPRAGGGWARPLPWGRGGGWGNKRSRSSEPVTWPTAERSPHKSPSPGTGAPWGDCGGLHGARAARASSGAQATRRRPHEMSSGGSAGGVTPSAATGAAFEPLRSLQGFGTPGGRDFQRPGHGLGGWPGGRSGGRDGTTAQRCERLERQFVQRASLSRSGKETKTAIPGHGNEPLPICRRQRRPGYTLPCDRA
jgi:hypothetical protein